MRLRFVAVAALLVLAACTGTPAETCGPDQCTANGECFDANDLHPSDDRICLDGEFVQLPSGPDEFEQ
jgi:hypothetical protein